MDKIRIHKHIWTQMTKKVPKIWFGVDLICQKGTLNGSKLDQNTKNRMDG